MKAAPKQSLYTSNSITKMLLSTFLVFSFLLSQNSIAARSLYPNTPEYAPILDPKQAVMDFLSSPSLGNEAKDQVRADLIISSLYTENFRNIYSTQSIHEMRTDLLAILEAHRPVDVIFGYKMHLLEKSFNQFREQKMTEHNRYRYFVGFFLGVVTGLIISKSLEQKALSRLNDSSGLLKSAQPLKRSKKIIQYIQNKHLSLLQTYGQAVRVGVGVAVAAPTSLITMQVNRYIEYQQDINDTFPVLGDGLFDYSHKRY